jgi:hypothetical protein
MRAVQQALHETVFGRRSVVIQHARQLPDHRIHQRHRRQFAARQYKVADADFLIDAALQQTLVHRFVPSAQQHQTRLFTQSHDPIMRQRPALRRHVHHPRRRQTCRHLALARRAQRLLQRPRQHHHARTAAIGPVVHRAVAVGGEIARIPQVQATPALLERAPGNARLRDC